MKQKQKEGMLFAEAKSMMLHWNRR